MSSARLQALYAERQAINSQLAALRVRRTTVPKTCPNNPRQWQLPGDVTKTLMLCYILSDYSLEPAVKYLGYYASRHKWSPKCHDELTVLVEHVFLNADMSLLSDLADRASTQHDAAATLASQFVEQWRIVQWATELNTECGVAPSSESVILKWNEAVRSLGENRRPKLVGCMADGSARMWAYRWRARWGAQFGNLPTREDIGTQELLSRATPPP